MITLNPRPPGLNYLCVAVAGHALAFYSVYNLLVYWLQARGFSDGEAAIAYGNFVAAAYLIPLVGGLLAGGFTVPLPWLRRVTETIEVNGTAYPTGNHRWTFTSRPIAFQPLGLLRVAIIGAALAVLGYGIIAATANSRVSTTALVLIVVGVGLSKPNISALVGRLFPTGSTLVAGAFAKYYSAINIGSLLPPAIAGSLYLISFRWAFASAVVGEVVALSALWLGRRHLHAAESASSLSVLVGDDAAQALHARPDEDPPALRRAKLQALRLFLILAAVVFWPAYHQNGSGLAVWAAKHTDLRVLGVTIPPTWFASINSIVCILLPSLLMRRFGTSRLSSTTAAGYIFVAASFAALVRAPMTQAHPLYLVAAVTLSSIAEVLISTIGLAQVAALAPRASTAVYMAIWYVTSAIGAKIAGQLLAGMGLASGFRVLAVASLIAAVVVMLLRRWLDVAHAAQTSNFNAKTPSNAMAATSAAGSSEVAGPAVAVVAGQ